MSEFFQPFVDLAAANPEWAGIFIFLMAAAETIVAIGYIIPGTWLMVSFGLLVGTGVLRFDVVFISLTLGGIVGDAVSYWLGRRYGRYVFRWRFFKKHKTLVDKSERFFARHGGKAVFLARALGPIRPLVPFFAGMMGMALPKFMLCNVASAILGSIAHLLPGMVVGLGLRFTGAMTWRLVIILALLAVLAYLGYRGSRWAMRFANSSGPVLAERLNAWARRANSERGMAGRLAASLALRFIDPQYRGTTALAALGVAALASFTGVVYLVATVTDGGPFATANLAVFDFLDGLRNPWADQVMVALLGLADLPVFLPLIVAVLALLLIRRDWLIGAYWALTTAFAYATAVVLELAASPETQGAPTIAAGVLPSGHAAVSVMLLGYLCFLCLPLLGQRGWRIVVLFTASALVVFVGFAELYFGTLYLSRLVGGVLLGLGWLAVLTVVTRRHAPNPHPRWARTLGLTALVVLIAAAGANFGLRHSDQLAKYSRPVTETLILDSDWIATGWQELPAYRVDFVGKADEPFNLQVGGDLESFRGAALEAGWREAPSWGIVETVGLVTGVKHAAAAERPVLPRFWNGNRESAVLVKPVGEGRLVLRVWDAGYRLLPGGEPLLLGTVEREIDRPALIYGAIHIPPLATDFSDAVHLLALDLGAGVVRHRDPDWQPATRSRSAQNWDGSTAVIGSGL